MSDVCRLLPESAACDYTHVLLMRHGRTDARAGVPERRRPLSPEGVTDVEAVSRRLAEWVALGEDGFEVGAVRHGRFVQVVDTMAIVRRALLAERAAWPADAVEATRVLDPSFFWAHQQAPEDATTWSSQLQTSADAADGQHGRTRALLVIGHEPQLSMVARPLLKPQPPWLRSSCVIPSAGVACIRLPPRPRRRGGRLLWVIEPEDKETADALRDKIKSKMDVAKVFGAVITFALGVLLTQLVDAQKRQALPDDRAVLLALAGFGLALVLYVRVLYALDGLLMPTRYWNASLSPPGPRGLVRRPPSSASLVMQQNMIRVWTGPFTLANVLVLVSFGLLGYGAVDAPVASIVALMLVAGLLAWWTRVDFGAQD